MTRSPYSCHSWMSVLPADDSGGDDFDVCDLLVEVNQLDLQKGLEVTGGQRAGLIRFEPVKQKGNLALFAQKVSRPF